MNFKSGCFKSGHLKTDFTPLFLQVESCHPSEPLGPQQGHNTAPVFHLRGVSCSVTLREMVLPAERNTGACWAGLQRGTKASSIPRAQLWGRGLGCLCSLHLSCGACPFHPLSREPWIEVWGTPVHACGGPSPGWSHPRDRTQTNYEGCVGPYLCSEQCFRGRWVLPLSQQPLSLLAVTQICTKNYHLWICCRF